MFAEDGSLAFQTDSIEMIVLVAILTVVGFGLLYRYKLRYEMEGIRIYERESQINWANLLLVFGLAFLLKIILAGIYEGHGPDMDCWRSWSGMIFEEGPWGFYHSDSFTDYPPGYMSMLWIVGALRKLFSLDNTMVIERVVIKFFPLVFDMATGFLLYKMARRKFSEGSALILGLTYVLNPLVVVDSSAWGQVDSVFTFFLFLVCYLCMEKKRIPAYFVFAAGILIKPQILMFAPVLIWTIIEQVFLDDFNRKKMLRDLLFGLAAIAAMLVFMLPFGIDVVLSQYVDTLTSYPFGTINATNFWALMGMNWKYQTHHFLGLQASTWGTIVIVCAVALSGFVFFKLKECKSRYFLSMAVLIGTMFCFSVRMHERYLFPIAILLLAGFVLRPTKELLFTYAAFSAVNFLNVALILYEYIENNKNTGMKGGIVGITSLLTILVYAYMFFAIFRPAFMEDLKERVAKKKNNAVKYIQKKMPVKPAKKWEEYKLHIQPTKNPGRFTKWDWCVLLGIILIYSVFAFYDLGYRQAPQTAWTATNENKEITIDLGKSQNIGKIYTFLGPEHDCEFSLRVSNDGKTFFDKGTVRANSVFAWQEMQSWNSETEEAGGNAYDWNEQYRYVQLIANVNLEEKRCILNELVVMDKDSNMILPANAAEYKVLFDEQHMFEPQKNAPKTVWKAEKSGEPIEIEFDGKHQVSEFLLHTKAEGAQEFHLEIAEEEGDYVECGKFTNAHNNGWSTCRFMQTRESFANKSYQYLRITPLSEGFEATELIIKGTNGEILPILKNDKADELFDEQDGYGESITFRSGTYFDEIYHARTAYEIVEGTSHYEWTHPPLGKVIISLGVRAFGMNPFGWRVMGVLFGIGMLPFMYLFGRRIFKGKIWAAGALTALFAFDFMHFTQTRIATIDVYGTFFIIAMYFFMYWYSQTSFYDTKLWKTFIPLGLSAIMMGLGCAAKWTAVYAAAGLGVFFFAIMGWRYYEYRLAKKEPKGETAGILHSQVLAVFRKNLIATLLFCILFFVVIAGLIYLLAYIPFDDNSVNNAQRFMGTDWDETPVAGLVQWLRDSSGKPFAELIGEMVNNQRAMYMYHHDLTATHPFESSWNEWPMMVRPVYYYCETLSNGLKEGISAFGNPLVWWAGIPALLFVVSPFGKKTAKRFGTVDIQWIQWGGCILSMFLAMTAIVARPTDVEAFGDLVARWGWYGYPFILLGIAGFIFLCAQMFSRGDRVAVFIIFAYAVQYVPWMLVPRCTFAYHYFPSVPFVTMLVVYSMVKIVEHDKKWFKWCMAYVAVAFFIFLLFYPVLSGQPILQGYASEGLRWLEGWQLIS